MVWKPSVTVAAVIERDGRFLFVEEKIDGRLVLNRRPAISIPANRWSPPAAAR
jgi:hypothetical protein